MLELPIEHSTVLECYDQVADILGTGFFEGTKVSEKSGIGLYSLWPQWNGDLCWISAGNESAVDFFQGCFDRLQIAKRTQELLGDHGELMMYSGFFVVRSESHETYYHVDYSKEVGLNAMTLMTPVFETGESGNLLYHDTDSVEQTHRYQTGRAVCFGGDFYHSTEPFKSDKQYVFLCFTFGVRDINKWDSIAETVTGQGLFYCHPVNGLTRTEDS